MQFRMKRAPTVAELGLAARRGAEDLGASVAGDDGLGVAEHGGDGGAALALHVLRAVSWPWREGMHGTMKNELGD